MLNKFDEWLSRNSLLPALLIIAAGMAFRVYHADSCYLNPDEALHVLLARADSLKEAYLQSRTQAHPPLLTLVLYFVLSFGSSEFLVRLPSLAAVVLGSWFGFKWAGKVFGPGVGLGVLALMTFSPAMMLPAVEVRQYGLLIMGICGALYGLENAFAGNSWKWMAFGHGCLYAAILSHYSALLITVSLGCYGFLRLLQLRPKGRMWIAWAVFQSGAALLYAALYFTHVKYMHSGWMHRFAVDRYLKDGYFQGGEESLPAFLGSAWQGVFGYMAGMNSAWFLAAALFTIGVSALLLIPARPEGQKRRDISLLLAAPLFLGSAGSLLDLLPLTGGRHASYLIPFVAAGVSFSLFRLVKYPAAAAVLLSIIAPAWLMWTAARPEAAPANHPATLPREEMTRALEFLAEEIPEGTPLLVDGQASLELEYYLGDGGPDRLVMKSWKFDSRNLGSFARLMADEGRVEADEPVWAMSTGWYNLPPLTCAVPGEEVMRSAQFGPISFILFRPGGKAAGVKKQDGPG